MVSSSAASRARERVEALGQEALDATLVRTKLLSVLQDVVAFDAYVWLLTDPVTTVGAAPLADVPCLPELPELIRAKYATVVNRWTALLRSPVPVGLLGSERERSLVWREVMVRYGIRDVASVAFADRYGCWGFLDLWRDGHRPPFDSSDAELLAALAPSVTRLLRECQARTFVDAARPDRSELGPVVLTLDDGLQIASRTAASAHWLDQLLPAGPDARAVPASVYNVAAQLLARELGIDDHPASARTHLGNGFWLTLRAARLASPGTSDLHAAGIVVTIEEASAADRLDLFARAFALSARESELVSLLATGADTRAMAHRMRVSENTVQDHFKSIFAKTGARDRVTILSRALGTRREAASS